MTIQEKSRDLCDRLAEGRLSRERFIRRMGAIGASAATIDALLRGARPGAAAAERVGRQQEAITGDAVSIAVYSWIVDFNPQLYAAVRAYNALHRDRKPIILTIAPTRDLNIGTFLLEAREHRSTWDAYFGATPFADMSQLHATGAIEPWDPYLSAAFVRDLFPAVRQESSLGGNLLTLPVMLDTVGYGYRKDYFKLAGISSAPATWEDFIAAALFKYGRHKQEVADFFEFLSYNQAFWKGPVFNGQVPCVRSAYQAVLRPWAPSYVDQVVAAMPASRAIPNARYNLPQFYALQDAYTPYLKGQISLDAAIVDARVKTRKAIETGTAG